MDTEILNTRYNWKNMPLLYLYLFQLIAEKIGKFDQEINSKLIIGILHRHFYHIPRIYDFFFLEELKYFGFLGKQNNQKYIFYGSNIKKAVDRLLNGTDELKDKVDGPLIYIYVFSRMLQTFGHKNNLVSGKQLISIWRKYIPNVARIYDYHILTEMCNYDLIRRINSQKYIFNGADSSIKLKKMNALNLW